MPRVTEGSKFHRYHILRPLGNSLSGESYEAEDTRMHRRVTLKLINPWSRLPDAARRQFFRQLQAISLLTHPNLAAILDYGESGGQLYVARHYTNDGSLSNGEPQQYTPPLALIDALQVCYQLAQSLHYLHSHGYTHGALTASNILLSQPLHQDEAVSSIPLLLADVGLAHFVWRFGQPPTRSLPFTAAPEQYTKQAVPASDQYALASLLYLWLTGYPPFVGTPEEVEQLKLSETLTSPRRYNKQITTTLEGVIRRALSAFPADRYPTIAAFSEALMSTLTASEETVLAQESSTQIATTASEEADQPATHPTTEEAEEAAPASTPVTSEESLVPSTTGPEQAHTHDQPYSAQTQPQQNEPSLASVSSLELLSTTTPSHNGLHHSTRSLEAAVDTTHDARDNFALFNDTINQSHYSNAFVTFETEPQSPSIEPQPQIEPDIPLPVPEPTPQPAPIPDPPAIPKPPSEPQPEPEVQPTPTPDIPQPVPEPGPELPPAPIPDITQPAPTPEQPDHGTTTTEKEVTTDTTPPAPPEQTPQASAYLTITSRFSPEARKIPLGQGTISLGRAGSSDILLNQDIITSRHHAILRYEQDGRYMLYDMRSAHGTTINGTPLTTEVGYPLSNGDRINIGEYELIFHTEQTASPDETSSQLSHQ